MKKTSLRYDQSIRFARAASQATVYPEPDGGFCWFVWIDLLLPWLIMFWLAYYYY